MDKRTVGCLFLVAWLVSACAALEQAPLVYSSKIAVGADVSATTTEAPGVSVVLGYKQVDAAYVPVAIARECKEPDKMSTRCEHEAYRIERLTSRNVTENGKEGSSSAAATARGYLEEYRKLLKQYDEQQTSIQLLDIQIKAKEGAADAAKRSLEEFDSSIQKDATLSPEQAQQRAMMEKTQKSAEGDLIELRAKQNIASQEVAKLKPQLESFKSVPAANADKLLGDKQNQEDAYSVFGSFDGKTGGNGGTDGKAGASLVVGKVFSTGMASQNLTSGLGQYYKTLASERAANQTLACIQMVINDERLKTEPDAKKIALGACKGITSSTRQTVASETEQQ